MRFQQHIIKLMMCNVTCGVVKYDNCQGISIVSTAREAACN